MAQIYVVGRITADLEQKRSLKGNLYVRFDLAENTGGESRPVTQYYQVWAWGQDAERLIRAHVQKGSRIFVTGTLELESYSGVDGQERKRMRIALKDWGYAPIDSRGAAPQRKHPDTAPPMAQLNGDQEPLPE